MYFKVFACLAFTSFHVVYTRNDYLSFQRVLIDALSSCRNTGYAQGCCVEDNCAALSGTCHCNKDCNEEDGGCCSDIEEIGCHLSTEAIKCQRISLSKGKVRYSNRRNHGSTAKMSCIPGYNLVGVERVTCDQDGTWSDAIPKCKSPKVNCSTTVTVNSSGCCTGGSDLCHAIGGGCYCDQNCYVRDDCCKDIIDIGCDSATDCTSAGFINGCCSDAFRNRCKAAKGDCYCDQECYKRNDCCPDIYAIGCKCATGSQVVMNELDRIKVAANFWRKYNIVKRNREKARVGTEDKKMLIYFISN